MNSNSKIKVVKKSEAIASKNKKRKPEGPRVAAREMVATMSEWVAEVKSRKADETRAAIQILLAATPRPNES